MALSPAEAAERLDISERRVRALLKEGRIPAQRVSGRWVIDELDVNQYRPGRPAGRPLSERNAWQFVLLTANTQKQGADFFELSAVEKHRLHRRLCRLQAASDPLSLLSSLLAKRAEKEEYSSSPADLAELREDDRLRLSGVSHKASGLLSNSEIEAYVSRKDFDSLILDWFLVKPRQGQRPNVVLHVAEEVPDELPLLLVAADLAERPGVREQDAALDLIRRIHAD